MMKKVLFFSGAIGIVIIYLFLSSHSTGHHHPNLMVFTQIPSTIEFQAFDEDFIKALDGARIVSVSKSDPELEILTGEFSSAAFPAVSYDLESIVFSARLNRDEPWQLWTMKLNGGNKKQLTRDTLSSIMPVFLPDGKIIFSREWHSELGSGYQLFRCDKDGKNMGQISFHPHTDLHTSILTDGRASFFSRQKYPQAGPQKWMVMRPDGTKSELFYEGPANHQISSKIHEHENGQLFFIEKSHKGDIVVQTNYANPELARKELIHAGKGTFSSVNVSASGSIIVSQKMEEEAVFALYEYSPGEFSNPTLVFKDENYHSFGAVLTENHLLPKILPTNVDSSKTTALLFCQNVNETRNYLPNNQPDSLSTIIRIQGLSEMLGEVEVESDGSFLLELPADVPLQLQALNSKKELLEGRSSWIWLRPNERRGCVGCHEPNGIAPANITTLSLKNGPIKIPLSSSRNDEVMVQEQRKGGDDEN